MGIKEERERMFSGLSPLRNHSMNQIVLKKSVHGQRALDKLMGKIGEGMPDTVSERPSVLMPLSEEFLENCFHEIVNIANRRVNTEEDDLTIPSRTFYLLSDVKEIYQFAIQEGLKDLIIDRPFIDKGFVIRTDYIKHPGLVSRQNLYVAFNKLPGWNQIGTTNQAMVFSSFYKAFEINLASVDFALEGQEAEIERVSTYGFLLANLSKLSYLLRGNFSDNETVAFSILESTKKGLKLKK